MSEETAKLHHPSDVSTGKHARGSWDDLELPGDCTCQKPETATPPEDVRQKTHSVDPRIVAAFKALLSATGGEYFSEDNIVIEGLLVGQDFCEESDRLKTKLEQAERERDEAKGYLERLFEAYAPQCKPLGTLTGICTQIDNLLVGLRAERDALLEVVRQVAEWSVLVSNHDPERHAIVMQARKLVSHPSPEEKKA